MIKTLKNRKGILVQAAVLIAFCVMAAASSSSHDASSSKSSFDYRGAAVGAAAGYNGYIIIGTASSESAAADLAASKGYSYYLWDSVNGNVYAK